MVHYILLYAWLLLRLQFRSAHECSRLVVCCACVNGALWLVVVRMRGVQWAAVVDFVIVLLYNDVVYIIYCLLGLAARVLIGRRRRQCLSSLTYIRVVSIAMCPSSIVVILHTCRFWVARVLSVHNISHITHMCVIIIYITVPYITLQCITTGP